MTKLRPSERQVQRAIVDYLDRALDPRRARFTHIPAGGRREVVTAANLKRDGVRKGWPDLVIVYEYNDAPRTMFLEVKAPGSGRLTPEQREFADFCGGIGAMFFIVRSVDEVKDIVIAAGIPTVARAA